MLRLSMQLKKSISAIMAATDLEELLKPLHPTNYEIVAHQIKMLKSHQLMLKNVEEWVSFGGTLHGMDNDEFIDEGVVHDQIICTNILELYDADVGTVALTHYLNLPGLIEQLNAKGKLNDCLFVYAHSSQRATEINEVLNIVRSQYAVQIDDVAVDTPQSIEQFCTRLKAKLADICHTPVTASPVFTPMQQAAAEKPAASTTTKPATQSNDVGGFDFVRGAFSRK